MEMRTDKKSTWGATGVSFLSFSKALCVCQSWSMFCESTQFVRGLIGSEACRVGSRGGRLSALLVASTAYSLLPENSLWGGRFHQRSSRYWRRFRWGGAVVVVLMGIADGSDGGNEDGRAPIFFHSHQIQPPLSEIGSPPCGSSPRRKGSTLCRSTSSEGDGKEVDELLQSERKKWGADRVFSHCNTLLSRQTRFEDCVRAYPIVVRSRYCWSTAAIEITGIEHGSGGPVGDGLALSPPAFPRSSALSGRKPVLQFFPLEWERANLK